jgi:heme/copper-type cytochrome/quinol oxidase subunit 4
MTDSSAQAQKKAAAFRRGGLVFIALAILTGAEFWVSQVTAGSLVLLFIIALVKAGLILHYFMHVYSLWSEEAHG